MNRKMLRFFSVMGVIPVIACANPLTDPMFGKVPPCEQGMLHPPGHPGIEFGEQLPPYLHGIDLTEAQQLSIKELIQTTQVGMKGKEKAGIEYLLYIQQQVFSKDYSDEKIADMIKKQVDQHEENEINMAKLDHAIFEVLTPEQKQQVQSNLVTFSERLKKLK